MKLTRIVLAIGFVVLMIGCAKHPPQEVSDLNRMWNATRDGCASVYLRDDVQGLEPDMKALDGLMADEKYRKARKQAETLTPRVQDLKVRAEAAKEEAKRKAEHEIQVATEALAAAADAEAETYASSEYGSARSKLEQARSELRDPCAYHRAAELAAEAARLARESGTVAAAEKKRLEEERRLAEEEARRRKEEEERRRKAKPAAYTVLEGNSLWRISRMEKIYGDPLYWPLLYEANKGMIRNPDLIYPNQELKILRDIPEDEMRARLLRFYSTYLSPATQ